MTFSSIRGTLFISNLKKQVFGSIRATYAVYIKLFIFYRQEAPEELSISINNSLFIGFGTYKKAFGVKQGL